MEKVSVIVPVYNTENYLKSCLNSIINQSYSCLEIILIDDGSIDRSGYICDEYAKKDERVRVIHQGNHGVSYSRNRGIKKATGEYIVFIDSDDTISYRYIEKLIEPTKKNDYDLIICNFKKIFKPGDNVKNNKIKANLLTGDLYSDYNILGRDILGSPCFKLYKKKLIMNNCIFFPEDISLAEDQWFNFMYYECICPRKYYYIDEYLYNNIKREEYSLSKGRSEKKFYERINVMILEKKFLAYANIKDKEKVLSDLAVGLIGRFVNCTGHHNSYVKFKERVNVLNLVLGNWHKASSTKKYIVLFCMEWKIYFPIYFYYMLKNKYGA